MCVFCELYVNTAVFASVIITQPWHYWACYTGWIFVPDCG